GGELGSGSRRFERARSGEDPGVAVDRGVVGGLADRDSSVLGANERELRRGARAHQLVRAAREVVLQDQVEARNHGDESKRDRGHDGDEETPADASWEGEARHRSVYPTPWTVVMVGAASSARSLRRRRA